MLSVLLLVSSSHAENWPGWRGPRGDGTSSEMGIPIRWGKTENILWKVPIPGTGHSSPIVWENRIFLTTCLENEQKRVLLCLDRRDGIVLWERIVVTARLERKHKLNSYASSTPATDGKYVWVTFLDNSNLLVACYDFAGNVIWKKSPGEFFSPHGFCSPPVLFGNLVIINGDQDAEAFIVALDKSTGAERWRADRPNRTRSYCPPIIVEAAGKKQLVLSGSKCVAAYDPETGKQLWIIDGPTEQYVAGLVFSENILFLTAGFPEYHLMGIRPDGEGNVTHTHVAWHERIGAAYVPSPIAHGPYFFLVSDRPNSDNGKASCLDARTGKRMWMERLGRHHSASPVSAGDHLYFLDDDGQMFVLKAGPKFEVVCRNSLDEECHASPAISQRQIFIRTVKNLYCIGADARVAFADKKAETYPLADLLLEVAELAKPESSGKFRVLDARPKAQYVAGHIPDALWVDHADWSKEFARNQDPESWAKRLGALGLATENRVVIYDDNQTKDAARIWWILRYWGFRNVRLLNGGWKAWVAEVNKVSREEPAITRSNPKLTPQMDRLAVKVDILKNIKSKQFQVIDARSQQEFCGETNTAKNNGAIPGAMHREWSDAIDPKTGRFKSPQELRQILKESGIDTDKPAVTYCQSGGRAAVMAFTLELMGMKEVRNYYRSWAEWGNADDTPVEKPKGSKK
jgi:3-mercaptopyruvate sulfurtransferase SseA/outer membrane protein assembly factor BamB